METNNSFWSIHIFLGTYSSYYLSRSVTRGEGWRGTGERGEGERGEVAEGADGGEGRGQRGGRGERGKGGRSPLPFFKNRKKVP